jgi:ribosome-associated heat shock protein Hsp15
MTEPEARQTQQIDRWLWFARFVKTRALAQRLVTRGKVRVNKVKQTKPSQTVSPGDIVSFMVHDRVNVIQVLAIGTRRGPAPEARLLYADINSPVPVDSPVTRDG